MFDHFYNIFYLYMYLSYSSEGLFAIIYWATFFLPPSPHLLPIVFLSGKGKLSANIITQ
jgi:hypothetical protein